MGALRAVPPPESPATASIATAAESGTEMDLLVAMRARVAKACDDTDASQRDLAALTRRLLEIVKEIKALEAAETEEGRGRDATPDEEFDGSAV